MASVTLRNMRKAYGTAEVIRGIDLDIAHGEFCVFVGPSGCGKSTLLRMIAGLTDISDGDLFIGEDHVNRVPAGDRGVAMVFQSYALYPHMSVRQNLSFGLENIDTPRAEIARLVDAVARMLQIEPLLDRRPKDLSGGQRQRVAIGRAVVREPRVFLFDEPLSNLDAELRVAMRGEIAALHRRIGNTMIYVTHDQVEAMTMADKIAILRDGTLEQYGAPMTLFDRPVNTFVAGFIGSPRMNFVEARVAACDPLTLTLGDGKRIVLARSDFAVTEGQEVTLGIRPNDLIPDPSGALRVQVSAVEVLGTDSYIYAATKAGIPVILHCQGQTKIRIGETFDVGPKPDCVHLFDKASGLTLSAADPAS